MKGQLHYWEDLRKACSTLYILAYSQHLLEVGVHGIIRETKTDIWKVFCSFISTDMLGYKLMLSRYMILLYHMPFSMFIHGMLCTRIVAMYLQSRIGFTSRDS
jgi:hypothetical protein